MSRLIDLMGTPTMMTVSATSDGITSDSSSAQAAISIAGMDGVLFIAMNHKTMGEGTNAAISIAYSTTGNGSDATTSTDIWASSNAVLSFTTALGLAAGSIRTLWVDCSSKNLTANGYLHVWVAAAEALSSNSFNVLAIPWPADANLPLYAVTVDAV